MAEVYRLWRGYVGDLTPLDPDSVASDVSAYVTTDFLEDPVRLLRERGLQEYFQLPDVVTHFFPSYQIGVPLKHQPEHRQLSDVLENGFHFLQRVGLLDGDVAQVRFPHSSVLMIVKRALCVDGFLPLIPYLENPPWYIASLISNSASDGGQVDGELRDAIHMSLDALFADQWRSHGVFQLRPKRHIDCVVNRESLAWLLVNLNRRHAPFDPGLASALKEAARLAALDLSTGSATNRSALVAASEAGQPSGGGTGSDVTPLGERIRHDLAAENDRVPAWVSVAAELPVAVSSVAVFGPVALIAGAAYAAPAADPATVDFLWELAKYAATGWVGFVTWWTVANVRSLSRLEERLVAQQRQIDSTQDQVKEQRDDLKSALGLFSQQTAALGEQTQRLTGIVNSVHESLEGLKRDLS